MVSTTLVLVSEFRISNKRFDSHSSTSFQLRGLVSTTLVLVSTTSVLVSTTLVLVSTTLVLVSTTSVLVVRALLASETTLALASMMASAIRRLFQPLAQTSCS